MLIVGWWVDNSDHFRLGGITWRFQTYMRETVDITLALFQPLVSLFRWLFISNHDNDKDDDDNDDDDNDDDDNDDEETDDDYDDNDDDTDQQQR